MIKRHRLRGRFGNLENPIFRVFLFFHIMAFALFGMSTASIAGPPTTSTGPEHVTELWEGKVLTATFRTGMCFSPDGKARGVLILRHANGNEDVYHLYGTIKNNSFDLSHSSGHFFNGRLTGRDTMEGKVKLNNGLKLSLEGKRIQDAPLLAKDCAPLPR